MRAPSGVVSVSGSGSGGRIRTYDMAQPPVRRAPQRGNGTEWAFVSCSVSSAPVPPRSPGGTGPSPGLLPALTSRWPSTRDSSAQPRAARTDRRRTAPTRSARDGDSGGRRASRPAWRRGLRSRLPRGQPLYRGVGTVHVDWLDAPRTGARAPSMRRPCAPHPQHGLPRLAPGSEDRDPA